MNTHHLKGYYPYPFHEFIANFVCILLCLFVVLISCKKKNKKSGASTRSVTANPGTAMVTTTRDLNAEFAIPDNIPTEILSKELKNGQLNLDGLDDIARVLKMTQPKTTAKKTEEREKVDAFDQNYDTMKIVGTKDIFMKNASNQGKQKKVDKAEEVDPFNVAYDTMHIAPKDVFEKEKNKVKWYN